jgi:sugar fermentation stimulation protein A
MNTVIYTLPQLYKAIVVARPSKTCKSPYLADIQIITRNKIGKMVFNIRSKIVMAHTPALGCAGLVASGKIVYVTKKENTKAKSKYTIYQTEIEEQGKKIIIGVNPNICNTLFEHILLNNVLETFTDYSIKREHTIGKSRIDFLLTKEKKSVLCEVKNVCLAYYEDIPIKEINKRDYSNHDINSKIAIFPDCNRKIQKNPISPRAIKHIDELIEASKNGYKCYLAFVIQRYDCSYYSPSKLDQTYYKKLQYAYKNGFLDIIPIQIKWIGSHAYVNKILKLDKDFIH